MDINESSIIGNTEVIQAMFTELGLDIDDPAFTEEIKLIFGDLLSTVNLRSGTSTRVGHDSPSQAFVNGVTGHGFFHGQIHIVGGTMETHWGDTTEGRKDPASLLAHNTLLRRKPITLTSPPPYRTCRDLIFISLYARVLRCLELVAGCESLDSYAEETTFTQLYEHATHIVDKYANPCIVDRLRSARARQKDDVAEAAAIGQPSMAVPPQGDTVFENAVLFMRDALIVREFTDAIKCGDSGRLILCIKTFALSYRGSGRTKYAYEMLHLVHNLTRVWPKPLRNIIVSNWLVNPTGMENAFIPLDLLQEHMNFWIKTVYCAKGSNASWEWLAKVSPCINVLRLLATQMNSTLGTKLGTKHHAPDLTNDIRELLKSLREIGVYELRPGRIFDGDKAEVPNITSVGKDNLVGPLRDYNEAFEALRERFRDQPLIGDAMIARKPVTDSLSQPITSSIPAAPTSIATVAMVTDREAVQGAGELEMRDKDDDMFKEIDDSAIMSFTFDDEDDLTLDF